MLNLGLSVPVELAYRRQLALGYPLKTTIQILDLEHNIISDVSHLLEDGALTAEMVEAKPEDEEVATQQTYSCHLGDPGRTIGFDSGSPADSAIFLDRMLKVYESVLVDQPEYQGWIDCPIFCGPITQFDRDNDIVAVEAQSKEDIASDPAMRNDTYKGNKVDAVKAMLIDTGEDPKYIDFPVDKDKTPKNISFVQETSPWAKAWLLVQTMAKTLFYDGRGIARMADRSSKVCYTFDGTMVTDWPQESTDGKTIKNAVKVTGSKSSVSYTAYAPGTHPLSQKLLGRNGAKRSKTKFMEDRDLKTDKACKKVAEKELDDLLRTVTDTTFEAHPVWALEIGDLVFVNLAEFIGEVRVKSFTKPSTVKDSMSVGFTFNVLNPTVSKIRNP